MTESFILPASFLHFLVPHEPFRRIFFHSILLKTPRFVGYIFAGLEKH